MTSKLVSLFTTGLLAITISAMPACVGQPPEQNLKPDASTPDASTPDAPTPDAPTPDAPTPPGPTGFTVSGIARDYFDNTGILPGVQVEAGGLQPPVSVTSSADGAFEVANIVEGSTIIPSVVSLADNLRYRPTSNPPILVGNANVTQNVYAISNPYLIQQLSNVGLSVLTPATSVAVVELYDEQGNPLVGIPAEGITLVDAQNQPVPAAGPFFLGANSRLHPTIDQGGVPPIVASELHDGKARVAFLDIPAGAFKLNVVNPDNPDAPFVVDVLSVADSAAVLRTGGVAGGIVPPPAGSLNFTGGLYPLLQTVAQEGFGCAVAGCHDQLNPAPSPVIRFDKDPTQVYMDMINLLGTIDVLTPTESTLYTKPLRELIDPQNHPNFTCPTPADPPCAQMLAWITAGAPLQ